MTITFFASAVLMVAQQGVTEPVVRADYLAVMDVEFARIDANGDGIVTAEEVAAKTGRDEAAQVLAANRQIFTRLDANQDGQLSAEEFAALAAAPPPADPTPFMQRIDLNRDGNVTLVEHRTVMLGTFDNIDADKDGVVTPAEMANANQPAPQQPAPQPR
ncbi:hypothetical protein [Altererythrobacter sp. ZODW24]|uniref:EF-hand domain-containing protein n=1 Tax=Altererythrobacter sp. ZODW24 TaxID=2185142 RepID=UPI000DF82AB3|nr:hypothetical protein [Altererythrobacter sp. ZODW24]